MCQNCSNSNCGGCSSCDKPVEIKYSSQIIWDGPRIDLPGINLLIEKCDPLNEVIEKLANKINELHP